MYRTSDSQSVGLTSGRINDSPFFTEEGERAFCKRNSSTEVPGLREACEELASGSSDIRLFLRCSGVAGGELPSEDATSVGDEDADGMDMFDGSKSRSGIGGVSNGRLVILRIIKRRTTLEKDGKS